MAAVACQVVRWVADEPQPGLVEAQLTDADGRLWSFIDKEPIFWSGETVSRLSQLESQEDLAVHGRAFEQLRAFALSPAQSALLFRGQTAI